MNPVPALTKSHPSFGVRQATFLFALDGEDGVRRFLAVQASRYEAVAVMERLAHCDGRVSDRCRLVATFPGCASPVGRDPLMESVPYADFVADVVDPDRLLNDPATATLFQGSLSDEERAHVVRKIQAQVAAAGAAPGFRQRAAQPKPAATKEDWGDWEREPSRPAKKAPARAADDEKSQKIVLSLQGLGFKKAAVMEYVQSLGDRLDRDPLPELVRDGIRKLS